MIIRPHRTHPGWYQLDGYINGKRERITCKSYSEAEQVKASMETTKPAAVLHPTLSTVVDEYLLWAKNIRKLAEYTLSRKKRRLEVWILPVLGKYRVKDLDQRILDAYGLNHTSVNYRADLNHLKAMIGWMVKRGYAEKLSFEIEMPEYQSKIKQLPTPQDVLAFLAAIRKEDHRMLFSLMLFTGMRWDEAKKLRWENYTGGAIRLTETKTGVQEMIAIPDSLQVWLEANKKESGLLFPSSRTGTAYTGLERALRAAEKKTGIKMSPHMFRHMSATVLYEATGDIYAVSKHLRHSSVAMTQVYTRYSQARSRRAVNSVVDFMVNSLVQK